MKPFSLLTLEFDLRGQIPFSKWVKIVTIDKCQTSNLSEKERCF